jgi:aminopeptidase N
MSSIRLAGSSRGSRSPSSPRARLPRGRLADGSPAPGVAHSLAESRAASIRDLRYAVTLTIPEARDSAVRGVVEASFTWSGVGDVVLDFRAPASQVGVVRVDGDTVTPSLVPDHVVIPAIARAGRCAHRSVAFTSTDAALNRNEEFLYALFVPTVRRRRCRCSSSPT